MKRINHGTAARATTTLLAASLLIAGVFVAPAQAAATCRVRSNQHLVRCSNDTDKTYEMRVRVLLENNKRPRFHFTLDPGETWKMRFNKQVDGLRIHRELVVTPPPGIGLYAYGVSTTWMDYLCDRHASSIRDDQRRRPCASDRSDSELSGRVNARGRDPWKRSGPTDIGRRADDVLIPDIGFPPTATTSCLVGRRLTLKSALITSLST